MNPRTKTILTVATILSILHTMPVFADGMRRRGAPEDAHHSLTTGKAPSTVGSGAPQDRSASPIPEGDRFAKQCGRTPPLVRYGYPGRDAIPRSSKLARPAGKSQFTAGHLLYVRGRVFDSACVPLRDADVELWHRNADGQYILANNKDLSNPYALFAGAGRVVTDNRGEFLFETIYPGTVGTDTPYLNIRVSHPKLGGAIQTAFFFEGEMRNGSDPSYTRLPEGAKKALTATVIPIEEEDASASGMLVHTDIVLPTRDRFRGF